MLARNSAPCLALVAALGLLSATTASATFHQIDLANVTTETGELLRIYGAAGDGAYGVPVAGGRDCDGDGKVDYAVAEILSSPLARDRAGQVFLVFGNGTFDNSVDTADPASPVLTIVGSGRQELLGSEIWMEDVDGDRIGDLIIGRQNFSPDTTLGGAGAVSIVFGSPVLHELASAHAVLDMREPPEGVTVLTIIGTQRYGRLGIWVRAGDVTGDGVADLVVGADQENHVDQQHSGAAYVIRGGSHLAVRAAIALDHTDDTALAGSVIRIDPGASSLHYHFGATCQIGDLDGNGRGEVLVAAAFNRAGGVIPSAGAPATSADGIGGSPQGTTFILWDNNFPPPPWPAGSSISVTTPVGHLSTLHGGKWNSKFGEELIGGRDWDADGKPDLYIGDLSADLSASHNRKDSGAAYILYDAPRLRGRTLTLDELPDDVRTTTMRGVTAGAITGDTAIDGDFDGDGIADLAVGSPHAAPSGRRDAGSVQILFGQPGGWPPSFSVNDLAELAAYHTAEVIGARGRTGAIDGGDVLAYSIARGDIDGDGRDDLIVNEMQGNGVAPEALDVGNLIAMDGLFLSSGIDQVDCPAVPSPLCTQATASGMTLRSGAHESSRRLHWQWRGPRPGPATFGDPILGTTNFALCIYNGATDRAIGTLRLRPESDCLTSPCWRQDGSTARLYRGPRAAPDSATLVRLREGGRSGTAIIDFYARGYRSVMSAPPLAAPVLIQLHAGASATTAACWESRYDGATRTNRTGRFAARLPAE